MPIKKSWRLITSAAALIAFAAPSAASAAPQPPAYVPPLDTCEQPEVAQTLLPFGDANLYSLAPGGTFSDSGGWELIGGAAVTTAVEPDGSVGGVLDLPSRAQATSPVMCITADYPMSRLFVRDVGGDTENITMHTSLWEKGKWKTPKNTGHFDHFGSDWQLSSELANKPAGDEGWQQVRFTLVAADKTHVQVDDFWVDPRASR